MRHRSLLALLVALLLPLIAGAAEIRVEMPYADRDNDEVEVVRDVWVDGVLRNQARLLPGQGTDTDGDGVMDVDDRCPNSRGPVNLCGCAQARDSCCEDEDGDGVRDCRDRCPGTYPGLPVDGHGCVAAHRLPVSLPLDVRFAVAQWTLLPGFKSRLQPLARHLIDDPQARVRIDGHADARGTARYNRALSQRRADAVAAWLINNADVPPEQVQTFAFGEEQPVVDDTTIEAHWANRRVQVTFLPAE